MSTYHEEMKLKETKRLREIQQELPPFTQAFFRGIAQTVFFTISQTTLPAGQGLPTPMTCGYFSAIFMKNTARWAA